MLRIASPVTFCTRHIAPLPLASGALVPVLAGYRVNPGSMDIGLLAIYQADRRCSSKIQPFIELLESALGPQNN